MDAMLTAYGMINFFYQLLFPFCSPEMSGVEDDCCMPFFSHVALFTNIYVSTCGGGIGMGHSWSKVMVPELVRWSGVPIQHGSLDGKPRTIYLRWNTKDPCYDSITNDAVMMDRWKSKKRYFKLNNNIISKQWGQEGYNPCTKYNFIYKCLGPT